MPGFLRRFEGIIYGVLRGTAGLLFACHGGQKLFGWFGGPPLGTPDFVIWVAGPIELVGGALVAAGLFTRWTAFLCSGLMAVAYFMVHQPRAFLPIQNGGEPAVLYAWLFLFIAAHGPGAISLDKLRGKS